MDCLKQGDADALSELFDRYYRLVLSNITSETETNEEGLYTLQNLPPGSYSVAVQKFGFKTIVKPGVELHVQDIISLNFAMDLGSIVESVTVEEGAPLLQAGTGMLGTTVDQTALTELLSLTRNPYDFVSLSPGSAPSGIRNRGVGVAVNGQRVESGNFLLDGSENVYPADSTPAQAVPLEAVREYRLQTHAFTAEYGRNVAFVANVVTKSGTNDFHGVLYDFVRNSALAANTFDNNAKRLPRPVFNRHQFGGTIGGPIWRDRAFFFAALEPIVVRSSAPVRFVVPTPQLVALSSPGTQAIFRRFPLPAELSSTDVRVHRVCPFGATCNLQTGAGLVTVPAFAATTRVGPRDAGAGPPQNTYVATARLDYSASDRTTVWGRYAVQDGTQFATVTQPYSAELDRPTLTRNQNFTLGLVRTWTGRFVTESRAVYSRIARMVPQTPSGSFPTLALTGESGVVLPSGLRAEDGPQNVYQVHHTASWLWGKHDFKFGGQYVHLRQNVDPSVVPVSATNYGSFAGVQDLVDGRLTRYQIWIDPKGRVPGETVEPPSGMRLSEDMRPDTEDMS